MQNELSITSEKTDYNDLLSVVILSYNRCKEVLITIDKLKNTVPFKFEIIVVDNASADNTVAEVKMHYPDVTLIARDKNNGIAGWNDGFEIAKNKYLLVLDDDSHMHSGLTEAIDYLDANPDVGIIGFEVKDEQLRMDVYLDLEDAWKDGDDIPGFIGCGAIIRKEVYNKIGGFAEWIFVYTHEFEYTIRCLNAGYKVKFFGKGIVVHRVSTINRSYKRLRIFGTRNEMAIVYKYFSYNRRKYIFRIFMNNLKFIMREDLKSGYYVFMGWLEFLKLKKTLECTPVSKQVQDFYANNFWSTKSVFINLKKKLKK